MILFVKTLSTILLAAVATVRSVPAPGLKARHSITLLTTSEIDAFTPYTWYASAGYCSAADTSTWACGANCEANPTFVPIASGGDGDKVQFWFVGYDPMLDTVIVSHQGTNPEEIFPLVTDADIFLAPLNASLFPGISSRLEVHNGFADEHAKTAPSVLTAVQSAISQSGTDNVTLVGHSLGAAISLLDAVYLPLHVSGVSVTFVGYGLPRVGNQAFANHVDETVVVTHINNKEDPIPIVPNMFLGYVHPTGEVHVEDSGEWAACSGLDNPDKQCIVGDVPTVFEGKETDHDGPYNGVKMGC